jgi:uncharacterized surface protein with fasciclin (FAS1) repeats
MLCSGFSAAQDDAVNDGVIDAANDLGLKTFSENLQDVGLANTLDNKGVISFGSGGFDIFAPSDGAIKSSIESGDIDMAMENETELKGIWSYHIIWNDNLASNITELSSAKTLQGENLSLNNEDGLKVNGANITGTAKYGSGTIYVIDKVLMPNKPSSLGIAEAASDLGAKKFAEAIRSAGFEERLNGLGLMGIESFGNDSMIEGPFTIFAPSDEAFNNAKTALDSISKRPGGTIGLLSYHIIDVKALANMTDLNSIKTLQGDSLSIEIDSRIVGGANVLGSERYGNGIVYIIDQMLVPIRLSI